eukprot:6325816-Amphidinium_carterae.4
MRKGGGAECRYSTVALAMWPGVEHGPWASAAAVSIHGLRSSLGSPDERISPGSDTSGTKHPFDTRAWLYRSRLSAHPSCVGWMSMLYPFLFQKLYPVEAWLDRPWRQLVERIGEAKNPGPL